MPPPTRYWRFSYDSEDLVTQMLATGSLEIPLTGPHDGKYDPQNCIEVKIKAGDAVFLGKLDPDLGVGRIVAIGIARNARPVTEVDWRRFKREVFPNPQGGIAAWRERCFLFSSGPVERYNLSGDFKSQFPDETLA